MEALNTERTLIKAAQFHFVLKAWMEKINQRAEEVLFAAFTFLGRLSLLGF